MKKSDDNIRIWTFENDSIRIRIYNLDIKVGKILSYVIAPLTLERYSPGEIVEGVVNELGTCGPTEELREWYRSEIDDGGKTYGKYVDLDIDCVTSDDDIEPEIDNEYIKRAFEQESISEKYILEEILSYR